MGELAAGTHLQGRGLPKQRTLILMHPSAWTGHYIITRAGRPARHCSSCVLGSQKVTKLLEERGERHPKMRPLSR
jgi:hypothetical protein